MNNLNTILKVAMVWALLLTAQSCYVYFEDGGFDCIRARGPVVSESYALPDFNRVTNTIGADITIRQSAVQIFEITAAENILDEITLRVIDGELIIDNGNCINNANIDIFIAMPDIQAVHNIGSGDIFGDNLWVQDDLELRITGSGKIDAEINAAFLSVEITGSGRLDLFGNVEVSAIQISGSGDVNGFGMESNEQDIVISGSGNCEVVAYELLNVVISGSGNVFYKGSPQVSATISGSGRVIDAN